MKRFAASRNAFTLIELLVVVAIIVALIAILLPSMSRAIEVANRAVCASQQHQQGLALLAYASDHKGEMPPGNATILWGAGIDSTYQVPGNHPTGLAYLIVNGYVGAPDVFYCPSWRHPHMQIGMVNTVSDSYGFGPGTMGGWPVEGKPQPTSHRGIAYHYRSTFGASANTPPSLRQSGRGNPAIVADHWTRREGLLGVIYGHVEGYMVLHMDGHTNWVAIDPKEMDSVQPTPLTNGSWGWQELFWQDWFDG